MYEALDCVGVLLAWDAETATGRPPLSNDLVAGIVARFPGRFVGFASVDPWKPTALAELRRAREELGLHGFKFHPSMQAFRPDDARFAELFERAAAYRAPCLFHTGTSGIGAGTPGGQGVELGYARPSTWTRSPPATGAAGGDGPLRLALAHRGGRHRPPQGQRPPGAVRLGAPVVPDEVVREAEGRLADQVLFGSDAPFFDAGKVLAAWEERLSAAAFASGWPVTTPPGCSGWRLGRRDGAAVAVPGRAAGPGVGRRRLAPPLRAALPRHQGVPLPRLPPGDLPPDPPRRGLAGGEPALPAPPLAQGLLGAALRRAAAGGAAGGQAT